MSDFDPIQFGMLMGQLVTQYRNTFSWVAIIPHITFLVLFFLILRFRNRYRKAFNIYFCINFIWILIFVGGWFSVQLYRHAGIPALMMYIGTPVLILIILIQWIQELRFPRIDLDLSQVRFWRWVIALPFMLWGFWYPPYEWGVRLIFDPKELLFGAYGLMGCPTTLVPLALLFLKYPAGNRPLFYALTTYAVIVGFAMVMLKYVPDIPFFAMGLISLGMILLVKIKKQAIEPGAPEVVQ
ncbi:hypothetical protein JW964_10670 [candidate division KSB1 bacterium]|nr:hypothetical protein [candidate division KSB1 bacterium]